VACPDEAAKRRRRSGLDEASLATRGLASWLARVAPASTRGELSVALVSDRRMRSLNRQFRGKDVVTDVLSFANKGTGIFFRTTSGKRSPSPFLGDIAIASGAARRQAREAGHSVATEVRVLALHGLLHLLGYDHERDDGRMARLEAKLRRKGGLPAGLIDRAQ
jgi:probable rRNA maturation factor